jgi:hypothetical protein
MSTRGLLGNRGVSKHSISPQSPVVERIAKRGTGLPFELPKHKTGKKIVRQRPFKRKGYTKTLQIPVKDLEKLIYSLGNSKGPISEDIVNGNWSFDSKGLKIGEHLFIEL